MFKKVLYLILSVSLLFILTACPSPTAAVTTPSGNEAPVGTFADADYIVLNGGLDEANGLYKVNGTSGNLIDGTKYDKISGTYYSLYQFTFDSTNAYWTIHSNIVGDTSVDIVTYYSNLAAVSNPPDTSWYTSFNPDPAPVPDVHSYPLHTNGSGPYTIYAYYEYTDIENDLEGNTIYTWYSSPDDGISGWSLIESSTNKSISTLVDLGYVKVVITPVDSLGSEGVSLESLSVDISSS